MFQFTAALWLTASFFVWVLACAEDKRKYGSVCWTANTFAVVILAAVPIFMLKFFLYMLS